MAGIHAKPTARLRELLASGRIIRGVGAHDVFSAMIIEQAGLEVVFLGGFGASASHLGLPDLNFITQTEMADCVRRTTARVGVPVIADGDTGHGDLHQVARTVELFEAAGAAGMLLEDQVAPKRCGHFDDKQVIPCEQMVMKLKAALATRRDPDFVIIARTDARAVEGFDAALERMQAYLAAGADVAFIEAPQSREELERAAREIDAPLFANMVSGGRTPILSVDELQALGYAFVAFPVETLMVCARALHELCEAVKTEGRVDHIANAAMSFPELKQLLGVEYFANFKDKLTDDEEAGDA